MIPIKNHASQGLKIRERRASQTHTATAPAKSKSSSGITSKNSGDPLRAMTYHPTMRATAMEAARESPATKAPAVAVTRRPILLTAPRQLFSAAADPTKSKSTHGIQRTSSARTMPPAPGAKAAPNVKKMRVASRNPARETATAAITEKPILAPGPRRLLLTVISVNVASFCPSTVGSVDFRHERLKSQDSHRDDPTRV